MYSTATVLLQDEYSIFFSCAVHFWTSNKRRDKRHTYLPTGLDSNKTSFLLPPKFTVWMCCQQMLNPTRNAFLAAATTTTAPRGGSLVFDGVVTRTMSTNVQRPNRFTVVYNKMQKQCPDAIEVYAKCIQIHSDELKKGICQQEFDDVKECFRQARKSTA